MAAPRILTFNHHEPYLCLLAKAGLALTVGLYDDPPLAREWQTKFRPVPPNITFMPESEWRREAKAGHFDVAIAQNETNALHLHRTPVPTILICHNRRTFLNTTLESDQKNGVALFDKLLARLQDAGVQFVFISESKRDDYGIPGQVIPPGIDVEDFGGYEGDKLEVLRVGNLMRVRDLMFDVDFQEEVCAGIANRVAGENPGIPGSCPSGSFGELLHLYRTCRCLLHVTREDYEDGYNLSTLEAMACGMPVVSLANRTSPLTDGVDGYVSDNADVLRRRIQDLFDDLDLARAIGAAGRETVQRVFPIEKFVERWREAIERAVESGVRPGGASKPAASSFPRLKLILDYEPTPLGPGTAFLDTARSAHDAYAAARPAPDEAVARLGFEPMDVSRLPVDAVLPPDAPASALEDQFPQGFVPQFYLRVDGALGGTLPDTEAFGCTSIAYHVHSDRHVAERLAIASRFQFNFVAEWQDVSGFVQGGAPNVAWLPPSCAVDSREPERDKPVDVVCCVQPGASPIQGLAYDIIGPTWPDGLQAAFAPAKIAVFAPGPASVTRALMEALAAEALVIAPESQGLAQLFEPGVHLVTYRDPGEVPALVEKHLADEKTLAAIASAGAGLVRTEHTHEVRLQQMLGMVMEAIGLCGGISGEARYHTGGYYCSPRPELAEQIPRYARRVLDCGCGGGEFGRSLKMRGAEEVVGIEVVERAWNLAKDVLDQAFLGDIETMDLPFDEGYFDCIVFGDVLEHLRDPEALLRKLMPLLSPEGVVVMSIPNVRFWDVVRMLGDGRWKYEDAGILDRTHLRFFTAIEMRAMAEAAGYEVLKVQPLSMWPAGQLPRNPDGSLTMGRITVSGVSDDEYTDFLTYQYLVIAGKPGGDRLAPARRALEEGAFERAYQYAAEAGNVDEAGRATIMAKASARLGRLEEAERLFGQVLAKRPGDAALEGEYGILLVAMNRIRDARPRLERAVAKAPENERFAGSMGLVRLAEGDHEGAFDLLRQALEAGFDNPALFTPFLQVCRQLGRLGEALDLLRRYVEFYPANIDLALEYARLLADSGKRGEARERLDTILLFSPGNAGALEMLEHLEDS